MKKMFAFITILFVLGMGICNGCYAEQLTDFEQAAGKWEIEYAVDDFGDPTDEVYLRTIVEGVFSNTATTDSDLTVVCFYDCENDVFFFKLLEYSDHMATYFEDDMACFKTKVEENVSEYELVLFPPNGVVIPHEAHSDLLNTLLAGQDIKCVIKINNSKYNFTLDSEGFNEIYMLERYEAALSLKNEKKYADAKEIFQSIGEFKDSKEQIEEIQVLIWEEQYIEAVMLLENQQFGEAIKIFEELDEYKDSKEQIVKAENAIKEQQYEIAAAHFENEKYEEAIAIFEQLGEYKDSKEQIIKAENAIKEQQYEIAGTHFENEKYEEAIAIFEQLGEYKDSKEMLEKSEEKKIIKKYDEAILLLKNEDTIENAYTILKELGDYKDCKDLIIAIDKEREVLQQLYECIQFGKPVDLYLETFPEKANDILKQFLGETEKIYHQTSFEKYEEFVELYLPLWGEFEIVSESTIVDNTILYFDTDYNTHYQLEQYFNPSQKEDYGYPYGLRISYVNREGKEKFSASYFDAPYGENTFILDIYVSADYEVSLNENGNVLLKAYNQDGVIQTKELRKCTAENRIYNDVDLIKSVQEELNQRGYDCGVADGIIGSKTIEGIKAFQRDSVLEETGIIDETLLNAIGLSVK